MSTVGQISNGESGLSVRTKLNLVIDRTTVFDTAANFTSNNPTLNTGQLGIETDDLLTVPKFKIGDGANDWNTLPYFSSGGGTVDVNTIGAAINGAITATPNDTDLVMSVESSVAKKNTWTQVKAFLKTYFDTVYTTTASVATQITTALSSYVKKGTLTTNYIPKATSSDTIGDSSITDNGSLVEVNSNEIALNSASTNHESNLLLYSDNSSCESQLLVNHNGYNSGFAVSDINTQIYRNDVNPIILSAANVRVDNLTASQIVETDASKNLVSVAKGTAYNKNFGTTAGTVLEGDKGLLIANNLSDVSNPLTARNNLKIWGLFLTGGNQTTTSDVSSNITDLVSTTLTASKRYRIQGTIKVGCNNTGGVKFQITLPSGASMDVSLSGSNTSNTTYINAVITSSATLSASVQSFNGLSILRVDGEISLGVTSGTIQFGFASGTNTQTSTVFQLGTHLTITQIN